MKKLLFIKAISLVLSICLFFNVSAITFPFAGINIEIPDSLKYKINDKGILNISGKEFNIYFATFGNPEISDKVEFDIDKIFMNFDKSTLSLNNFTQFSEENHTSDIYYPKRYIQRHYISNKDNRYNVVTYTFYTPKRPYVCAVYYTGEVIPAEFKDIISSIDDNSSFLSRQWSAVKEGGGLILLFGVIAGIISNIIGMFCNRDSYYTKIAIFVTIVFIILSLWFYPNCILFTLFVALLCFLLSMCGASLTFKELINSILEYI